MQNFSNNQNTNNLNTQEQQNDLLLDLVTLVKTENLKIADLEKVLHLSQVLYRDFVLQKNTIDDSLLQNDLDDKIFILNVFLYL